MKVSCRVPHHPDQVGVDLAVVAGEQFFDEGAVGRPFGRGRHADLHSPGSGLERQIDPAAVRDARTWKRVDARQAAVTAALRPL